jgi:hypothetical protein
MNKYIDDKILSNNGKVIVFSDKAQNKWKMYGLTPKIKDGICGLYRSSDHTEDCLNAVNKNNTLIYPVTLATRYLGVGVEVKDSEDGHIVMNLDEGFDISFIEQCIGRFRKSKNIYVHLFASKEPNRMTSKAEEEEYKTQLMAYYVDLYEMTEEGSKMNLLKAMKLNVRDGFEEDDELRKAIGMLLANNICESMNYSSITDVKLLMQRIPFEKTNMNVKVVKLGKTEIENNLMKFDDEEEELKMYLVSLDNKQMSFLMKYPVNEILDKRMVPYKDRVNAKKILKMIKSIVKRGWSLLDWMEFFEGKLSTMVKEKDKMVKYCKYMRGDYMDETNGDETLEEMKVKLQEEFKDVELLWNKDFLNSALCSHMEIVVEDIFEMLLDDIAVADAVEYFNFKSYKEYKKQKGNMKKKTIAVANGMQTTKSYKIVTDKLENKYGLQNGTVFNGRKEIHANANIKSDATIDNWIKKQYIIAI